MKPSLCALTTSLLSVHAIVDAATAHLDMKPQNMTRPSPSVPLAPSPLPPPGPASHGEEIVRQLRTLTRANISRLKLVKRIPLEGDVWEPEGIVRLAAPGNEAADDDEAEEERFWVSAGEYTTPTEKYPEWRDGTDRSAGAGFAHFLVFDGSGQRVGDWVVSGEGDDEYHNGGIDYDGRYIWATLSQYRPNSTGTVVRVDPAEVTVEKLFGVDDHQGGIVHDTSTGTLTTLNWGGRKARRWNVASGRRLQHHHDDEQVQLRGSGFAAPGAEVVNPSHWIDYQDCKALGRVGGRELMLCSGVATLAAGVEVGGLAVVDAETLVPVWEVPFMERAGRVLVTKNPMDVALVGGRVRLYFAPEERTGAVYVYELRGE